jgi:hypothetical protein
MEQVVSVKPASPQPSLSSGSYTVDLRARRADADAALGIRLRRTLLSPRAVDAGASQHDTAVAHTTNTKTNPM